MNTLRSPLSLCISLLLLIVLSSSSVVHAQIKITRVFPLNGTPGNSITIYGIGFDATVSDNTVTFSPVSGGIGTTEPSLQAVQRGSK